MCYWKHKVKTPTLILLKIPSSAFYLPPLWCRVFMRELLAVAAVRRLSLIWLNKYCPNKNTIKGEQRKLYADHQADTGDCPHLSPGVSLISDLAHDSGMLQSELFTSRSQNLVLAKLPNSGFWRYGQFFKWNRVKMAKNGLKMVENFWGGLIYGK